MRTALAFALAGAMMCGRAEAGAVSAAMGVSAVVIDRCTIDAAMARYASCAMGTPYSIVRHAERATIVTPPNAELTGALAGERSAMGSVAAPTLAAVTFEGDETGPDDRTFASVRATRALSLRDDGDAAPRTLDAVRITISF